MAIDLNTPKEFNATLQKRAMLGIAYVISANEYNSLPKNLKMKYYPLFRRADTTYRLYPRYMRVNPTLDPNTQVIRLVPKKRVSIPRQAEQDMPVQIQKAILPINAQFRVPNTDLNSKTINVIAQETKTTVENRATINTNYSRY